MGMRRFVNAFKIILRSYRWKPLTYVKSEQVTLLASSRNFGGRHIGWTCGKAVIPLAVAATSFVLLHDDSLYDELFKVIKNNDIQSLKRLLQLELNVNRRHKLGFTCLHVAVVNKNLKAVQLLLEAGANPNISDNFMGSEVIAAELNMSAEEVKRIRREEFSDEFIDRDFSGLTSLHYAVLMGDEDIIKALLEAGANPKMKHGWLPADLTENERIRELLMQGKRKPSESKSCKEREPLERMIKKKIVGQNGAIAAVSAAISRRENGWQDEDHPLVMLFLGSSGIGKTETAKQIANYLHGKEDKGFIRIDMSEYQSKHEVSKFIGSPPGYVGHGEGGQLTKKLKEFPNAVVLFDEIEKAHPDLLTILLQLFDEGRMTDGKGVTVECKSAIFIMTSNIANEEIANYTLRVREEEEKKMGNKNESGIIKFSREFRENTMRKHLKRHLKRDEFIGRINEMVFFVPFTRTEILAIVTRELDKWAERAKSRRDIELHWSPKVVDLLADGYNVHYGARSIKHEIERRVVSLLSMAQERKLICGGSVVRLEVAPTSDATPSRGHDERKQEGVIRLHLVRRKPEGREEEVMELDVAVPSETFQ